jgi:Bacteriophage head to tail connecting protein
MDLETALRRFETAKGNRGNWDTIFQEIADRVLPQMADFTTQRSDGAKRTEYMFDSTAALAAQKGVAAISTFIWPPNQRYQKLTSSNDALNKVKRVSEWMDAATKALFATRYSPRAAFESQMGETALQHFVFGTGLIFVDDNIKQRALRYKSMHLAQTYVLENAAGIVDTVFRSWKWTLRQLDGWIKERQAAGYRTANMPESLLAKLRTRPDEQVEVVHMVMPREDYDPERVGYLGMPWASCYALPGQKYKLEEGGFNTWPFGVMRCMTSPGEVYGRSPAWMALSNIKVLNVQKKTVLQAGQKVVDPPLLLSEDGILGAFSMAPGALNYGGLDSQGNQLVKPLITNAKVEIGLEMMDKEREIIASAFLLDVFRVLIEHPNMTATQTLELLQERATLISPIGGRIENECFGPVTERELDLMMRAGQLPPMPPELLEAEGEYKIEYTSPMRQAMRASEAIAITRTLEAVLPMAEADPSVLDAFDLPMAARELAEINGVPAKILRDIEAVKARQDERAQQQEMQSLVEAAPAVSAAAVNLTKMQAAGGRPQL